MSNLLRIILSPLIKSQVRLYIFFGILAGSYQLILFIKYQEFKMFGLGMIKGTIIGMGLGVMAGLAIKEVCKMKKKKNQISKTETDIVNPENS